jgi:hypothetical protein
VWFVCGRVYCVLLSVIFNFLNFVCSWDTRRWIKSKSTIRSIPHKSFVTQTVRKSLKLSVWTEWHFEAGMLIFQKMSRLKTFWDIQDVCLQVTDCWSVNEHYLSYSKYEFEVFEKLVDRHSMHGQRRQSDFISALLCSIEEDHLELYYHVGTLTEDTPCVVGSKMEWCLFFASVFTS